MGCAKIFNYLILAFLGWVVLSGCDPSEPGEQERPNNQIISDRADVEVGGNIIGEGAGSPNELEYAPQLPNPSLGQPVAALPAPLPAGGGGGGSQGALQKAATGNPDDDDPKGPDGVCGNGIQEQSRLRSKCPFRIYGTAFDLSSDLTSELYAIDENTGKGSFINEIRLSNMNDVEEVSAIDFSPQGVLYGISNRSNTLITIDCVTGEAQEVADISGHQGNITDINFDSNGQLFAYDKAGEPQYLATVNPLTGVFTQINSTGLEGGGNGIGFYPFPSVNLYHADNSNLHTLDTSDASPTVISSLGFLAPIDGESPRINAMDYDIFNDIMYVSVNDAPLDGPGGPFENYVTKINMNSGLTMFLPLGPELGPDGLDGLAINQAYEECDSGGQANGMGLPQGAECGEDCELHESNCDDLVDNDFDGLIDCADPDCGPGICDDGNECTEDLCVAMTGECQNNPLEGAICGEDDDVCTRGVCVIPEEEDPFCLVRNLGFIPTEDDGCLDDNPCTADSCIPMAVDFIDDDNPDYDWQCNGLRGSEAQAAGCVIKEKMCVYESMVGAVCQSPEDGNLCTTETCKLNEDGTDVICSVEDGQDMLSGPHGDKCGGDTMNPGTGLPGICDVGVLMCDMGTETDMCVTVVRPGDKDKDCSTALDNDCNGIADNQEECDCSDGMDNDSDGFTDGADSDCPGSLVFVTATAYNGNFGGAHGAHARCQEEADAAGRSGTYHAWISSDVYFPAGTSGFTSNTDGFFLSNGTKIADNWSDLSDNTIDNPIDKTIADGVPPVGTPQNRTRVWTGTIGDGTRQDMANRRCNEWTTGSNSFRGVDGKTNMTNEIWTYASGSENTETEPCDYTYPIYCFEQTP